MPTEAQQAEWLERVLDLSAATPGSDLLPIWTEAKDEIDQQIAALQASLREIGSDLANEVADRGLDGLATGWNVRLMMALLQYDQSDAARRQSVGQKVLRTCAAVRSDVAGHPVLAMLQRNPLGVRISIGAVADRAIANIEAMLRERNI